MSNKFDALTTEQEEFLISYIKHSGDLYEVIDDVSVPGNNGCEQIYNANIIWLGIQKALGVPNENYKYHKADWPYTTMKKPKASDIVKARYYHECLSGNDPWHYVRTYLLNNDYTEIQYLCHKEGIRCKKEISRNEYKDLHEDYQYKVLDMIVDALIENLGTLPKGSQTGKNAYAIGTVARCYKINYLDTVLCPSNAGSLSIYYAILASAGIIHNEKNTISLTAEYMAIL